MKTLRLLGTIAVSLVCLIGGTACYSAGAIKPDSAPEETTSSVGDTLIETDPSTGTDTLNEQTDSESQTATPGWETTTSEPDTSSAALGPCGQAVCEPAPTVLGTQVPALVTELSTKPQCPESPWRQVFPQVLRHPAVRVAASGPDDYWLIEAQSRIVHVVDDSWTEFQLEGLSPYAIDKAGQSDVYVKAWRSGEFSIALLRYDGEGFIDVTPPSEPLFYSWSWTPCGELFVWGWDDTQWGPSPSQQWVEAPLPLLPGNTMATSIWHGSDSLLYAIGNYCRGGSRRFPGTNCLASIYRLVDERWTAIARFPFEEGSQWGKGSCDDFVSDRAGHVFARCEFGLVAVEENAAREIVLPNVDEARLWTGVAGGCDGASYLMSQDPPELYFMSAGPDTAQKVSLPPGQLPVAITMLDDRTALVAGRAGGLMFVEGAQTVRTTLPAAVGWRSAAADSAGRWYVVGEHGALMFGPSSSPTVASSPQDVELTSVSAQDSHHIAVGGAGYLARFDGMQWASIALPLECTRVNDVWVAPGGTWIFAACDNGDVLRCLGDSCEIGPIAPNQWSSLLGFDHDEVIVAGQGGAMARFDGEVWSNLSSPTVEDIVGLEGRSVDELWLLTESGAIWQCGSAGCLEIASLAGPQLGLAIAIAIAKAPQAGLVALFTKALGRWDGETWTSIPLGDYSETIDAMTATADGGLVLFGQDGLVLESACL